MPSAHGPIFCRRQKIGVKIGPCALTFGPRNFSELLATKNRSCALTDSVREKIGPSLRLFLGPPYDKKSVRVRWALHGCGDCIIINDIIWLCY